MRKQLKGASGQDSTTGTNQPRAVMSPAKMSSLLDTFHGIILRPLHPSKLGQLVDTAYTEDESLLRTRIRAYSDVA